MSAQTTATWRVNLRKWVIRSGIDRALRKWPVVAIGVGLLATVVWAIVLIDLGWVLLRSML